MRTRHTCICEDSEAKAKKDSGPRKYGKGYDAVGDDVLGEDEPELSDPGDDGYQNGPQEKDQFNGTGMDYDGITNEEPELEEILSD
ncbi:hypothetical protein OIU77_026207 [Salix suchowensis]|uniref:Uncharacterized protein n=1 Tax=Salix suchowensis TaxID=1278906 RepID=A0ABQ9BYW1_9ROSI|nr:hypothetical protein OIU77_026207 [Salix suchowensis]